MASYHDTQPLPDLSDTEWAYIAGIIDGEGSIGVMRSSRGVQLTVNMADDLPRWLAEKLGGRVRDHYPPSARAAGRKPQVHWRLTRQARLLYVLDSCLPYMRTKRKQATLAAEFLRVARWSPPDSAARREAFAAMEGMNR